VVVFLDRNKCIITFESKEPEDFAVLSAADKLPFTDIATWLKNNTEKGDE
jgi:hypothetical protein